MKVLLSTKTDHYKEIIVERSYFFGLIKKYFTYRKSYDGTIMEYRHPDTYINLSLTEWLDVKDLFSMIKF